MQDSIDKANSFMDESNLDLFVPVDVDQISMLALQGNNSSNWLNVFILKTANSHTLSRIMRCTFNGIIYISEFTDSINEINGIIMPSGLYDSFFTGICYISNFARVSHTAGLGNIYIGKKAAIINCGFICGISKEESGKGIQLCDKLSINIGPETGGRNVVVTPGMNFSSICQQLFATNASIRNNTLSSATMNSIQEHLKHSNCMIVSDNSMVASCDKVVKSFIGPNCKIHSSVVDSCILQSTVANPIYIDKATLSHCIMNESCRATSGCYVEHVYMCENSCIVDCARVTHTVVGPDCSIGEE